MKRCTFCDIAEGRPEPDAKVYEDESVIAFFDRASIAPYHTLVVPKRHSDNIFDVTEADLAKVTATIRRICLMYREKLDINDVQIVCSNGAAAQQDTLHLHFHIVPRAEGDGQDILWTPDPSLQRRFQELLSHLENG